MLYICSTQNGSNLIKFSFYNFTHLLIIQARFNLLQTITETVITQQCNQSIYEQHVLFNLINFLTQTK